MKVQALIQRLGDIPDGWEVRATRAGESLEVWDPDGAEYGFVFTDGRPTRMFTDRRRLAATRSTQPKGTA
jgi:hypothetical protein